MGNGQFLTAWWVLLLYIYLSCFWVILTNLGAVRFLLTITEMVKYGKCRLVNNNGNYNKNYIHNIMISNDATDVFCIRCH